jgi:multiple sugar transport system permease protein
VAADGGQTENLRPVMVGVSYVQSLRVLWGQIMAYSTLITIPVLVMFWPFSASSSAASPQPA